MQLIHYLQLHFISFTGKSGIVAERLSASLASTGTPSHFVHAAEWTHGDLGRVRSGDVVVFLSHSGNTKECVNAAELLQQRGIPVLAIVGKLGMSNQCVYLAFVVVLGVGRGAGLNSEDSERGQPILEHERIK